VVREGFYGHFGLLMAVGDVETKESRRYSRDKDQTLWGEKFVIGKKMEIWTISD
jgi:hypothetical protein